MRSADQETLDFGTPLGPQSFQLRLGFNAFGHYGHAKTSPQSNDSLNHRQCLTIAAHLANEGLVDLHLVEGELSEIAQGRITRTEIIHGDPNAKVFQLLQNGKRSICITDQKSFRDFQLKAAGIEACFIEDRFYVGGQVALRKLQRGKINRHAQSWRPSGGLTCSAMQYIAAELSDKPAFLGDRYKQIWRYRAALGMIPARECLEACHLAGFQVGERLVMQFNLASP